MAKDNRRFSVCPCGRSEHTIFFADEGPKGQGEARCPKHRPPGERTQGCSCVFDQQTYATLKWCKGHLTKYPLTTSQLGEQRIKKTKKKVTNKTTPKRTGTRLSEMTV